LQRYLEPDKLVPLNGTIAELAKERTAGDTTPIQKARPIYDYVLATRAERFPLLPLLLAHSHPIATRDCHPALYRRIVKLDPAQTLLRSSTMSRLLISRLALAALLAATLLSTAALAQSQDTQSVADAARRARDQKKPPAKPAKVITDEDIKPAVPAGTATPASPDAAAATATPASSASSTAAPASAPAAGSRSAPDAKDQKESKEVTELKAQIKKALDDLNLVLREQSLENDKFYSNTDYVHDTAGKAKLDELIQQAGDKQQVLDRLKAQLTELLPPKDSSVPAPPKP
jgi:hypothetical protein